MIIRGGKGDPQTDHGGKASKMDTGRWTGIGGVAAPQRGKGGANRPRRKAARGERACTWG